MAWFVQLIKSSNCSIQWYEDKHFKNNFSAFLRHNRVSTETAAWCEPLRLIPLLSDCCEPISKFFQPSEKVSSQKVPFFSGVGHQFKKKQKNVSVTSNFAPQSIIHLPQSMPRQGCQIYLDTIDQSGYKCTKVPPNYQMAFKYTKWPKIFEMVFKYTKRPKIFQMAFKYLNIFSST
jgi:hypothetical protein